MTCGRNQFCFTHIDTENDFVSRGCISMPAYNAIYIYCKTEKCNNIAYQQLILNDYEEQKVMKKMTFRVDEDLKNTGGSVESRKYCLNYFSYILLYIYLYM